MAMEESIKTLSEPVKALYLATYIPRKCGIATFTKDLINAVNLLNPLSLGKVAVMDNALTQKLEYPHEVKMRIQDDNPQDYIKVADYVNMTEEFEAVVLQHEFGIFGGPDGENILELTQALKKPLLVTFHTVVSDCSENMRRIMTSLCTTAKYVVVMLQGAKEMLIDLYGAKPDKVVVIHHGVPDFPMMSGANGAKNKLGLDGKTVMTSINLLGANKGLEHAIEAIPAIKKRVEDFVYLIVGETHPIVKQAEGEAYRQKLENLASQLGVSGQVRFVNKYLGLGELVEYIAASDFYVTPYLNPQQAASGSLAYAIGAGKACISTPYAYAAEMLGDGRGMLVPFRDGAAIAQSVLELLADQHKREECQSKAYAVGRTMTWHNVAHQYYHLYQYAIGKGC